MIILDKPFPKNCENCPFGWEKPYENSAYTIRVCVLTKENCDLYYYKRHPKCPLKENV